MLGFRYRAPGTVLAITLLGALSLCAQPPAGRGPGRGPRAVAGPARGAAEPGRGRGFGQPVQRMILNMPQGRWWTDPATAARLGLTADQQKQMDGVFQQNRPRLIDLNASLQKEELALEPLLNVDHPDQAKALAQIDRIAQARADLEKANARMLLGLRAVLSPDQWKTVQSAPPREGPPAGTGGRDEED